MTKHSNPNDVIIRLEAQILGIAPVVSRTLELPRDLNFAQLHEALQAAFGWTDSHLHQFIVGGLAIGAPEYLREDAYAPRVIEATEVHLRDLRFPYGPDAQLEILYQYDFGDNWQHRLILSEMPPAAGVKYPRCIAGSRACPPEDVGGDIGYEQFLEAWRDPEHEEHAANRRWAGRKFDPERFDLEAANRAIARALRRLSGATNLVHGTTVAEAVAQSRWTWFTSAHEALYLTYINTKSCLVLHLQRLVTDRPSMCFAHNLDDQGSWKCKTP